jgi:hypothetical protein
VALFGTIGSLTIYILSVGPAAALLNADSPQWAWNAFGYVYCPLCWLAAKSDTFASFTSGYIRLFFDETSVPANQNSVPSVQYWPDEPPFFVDASSTLLGAFLIWNVVRWFNQRGTTRSA